MRRLTEILGCTGATTQRPFSAVPRSAAKHADESKRGQHNQSIAPSRPTRAAPDRMRVVIKVSEVAAPNVHGADAEACGAGIDAVEVHQALQGPLQLAGVLDAGGVNCSGWLKPRN